MSELRHTATVLPSALEALRAGAALHVDAGKWAGRVRAALDEDRLEVYSQPIVALTAGAGRSELLPRLIGRDGEVIPAEVFLPPAETFGLIRAVDRRIAERAVRVAARGTIVHVNVSGETIADGDLLDVLQHELTAASAAPENVTIEIAVPEFARDAAAGAAFAAGLSRLGCGLSLQDFTPGAVSPAHLAQLRVQSLKIDRDIVRGLPRDPSGQRLVQEVVALARSIQSTTIAVGVEDEQTLTLLRECGVDYAQGVYIASPSPVEP